MIMIGVGAGLGAGLRWQLTQLWKKTRIDWPLATLVINLVGSFALGLLSQYLPAESSKFWTTGLLGGFTTFSTFNVELISLFDEGRKGAALLYITSSYLGGLLLTWLGMQL